MPTKLDPNMTNVATVDDVIEPRPLGMDSPLPAFDLDAAMAELPPAPEPEFDLDAAMAALPQDSPPPSDSVGPRPEDSPSVMGAVGQWFGTRTERAKKNWQRQTEESHAFFKLGKAIFENDQNGMVEAGGMIDSLPPAGQEEQDLIDRGLGLAMSIPNTIFEGDRLTASADAMQQFDPMIKSNPMLALPAAAIGATGLYDSHVISGMVAHTLLKEGVDPQIAKNVALLTGHTGSALGWVGTGLISKALPSSVKRAIIEEATKLTVKEVAKKSALSRVLPVAGELAKAGAVGGATMATIEADKITMTNLGRAISNNVDDTVIPYDSIPHALNMIYSAAKVGVGLGAVAHTSLSTLGTSLVKINAMRKSFSAGEGSVSDFIKKADERSARDLAVSNEEGSIIEIRPDDGGINERLSFEEDAYRGKIAGELEDVPEADLDAYVQQNVITRGGKDSGVGKDDYAAERTVLDEKIYALRKELGSKEPVPKEEIPVEGESAPAAQRIDQPAPREEGVVPQELLDREQAAKDAVKTLKDAGGIFTDKEVMLAEAELSDASKAVREAKAAGTPEKEQAPTISGITERKRAAQTRDKELKEAGVNARDPERAQVRQEIAVLKSLEAAKKKELADAVEEKRLLEEKVHDQTVRRGEEAEIRAKIALKKAQDLAEPGWLEPSPEVPEMTAESNKQFREQLAIVRAKLKAARTAEHADGIKEGKAELRQLVDRKMREKKITEERNGLIGEINSIVREGARKDGKTDADTTATMASLRAVVNMTKAQLDEVLTGVKELPTGADKGIILRLLKIKTDRRLNSLAELRILKDAVTDLLEKGQEKRFEYLIAEELRQVKLRRGAAAEVLGADWVEKVRLSKLQVGNKMQGIPRNRMEALNHFFDSPGEFVTANFPGIGKILMRDVFKDYDGSTMRQIFDTTKEERLKAKLDLEAFQELDQMYMQIYGKDGKMTPMQLARWKHELINEPSTTVLDKHGWPAAAVGPDGKAIPILLNRGQRIMLAAVLDRPGIFETFQKTHGFTEETKAAIQNLLPEDELMRQFLFSFAEKDYAKKNAVYAQREGNNLPKIENYSGSIQREGFGEELTLDPLLQQMAQNSATPDNITSLMRAVEYSDKPIKITNFLIDLENMVKDTNQYVAYSQKAADFHNTLLNAEFIDAIKTAYDPDTAGALIAAMRKHVEDISTGKSDFRAPGWTDWFRSNAIRATIFARATIGMKQLNQMMLFATEPGFKGPEFLSGVAEYFAAPIENGKIMKGISTPLEQRGLSNIDSAFSAEKNFTRPTAFDKKGLIKFYQNEFADRYLSANIVYPDRTAVYAGGYSLFRHLIKPVEEGGKGMSVEEAGLRVEAVMNNTQQTSAMAYLTPFQKSPAMGDRLLSNFTSGPFSSMRMSHEAVHAMIKGIDRYGRERDNLAAMINEGADEAALTKQRELIAETKARKWELTKQAAKVIGIAHVGQGMLYALMSNYGHWDTADEVAGVILGSTGALLLIGPVIENSVRAVVGLKKYQDDSGLVQGSIQSIADLFKSYEDKPERLFYDTAAEAAKLPSPLPFGWLTNVGFSVKDDLLEGDIAKFIAVLAGATPNSIDRIRDSE